MVFLVVTTVIFGLYYGSMRLDLLLNSWLREVPFTYWSLFTSHHGVTLCYLHNPVVAIVLMLIVSVVVGLVFQIFSSMVVK